MLICSGENALWDSRSSCGDALLAEGWICCIFRSHTFCLDVLLPQAEVALWQEVFEEYSWFQ